MFAEAGPRSDCTVVGERDCLENRTVYTGRSPVEVGAGDDGAAGRLQRDVIIESAGPEREGAGTGHGRAHGRHFARADERCTQRNVASHVDERARVRELHASGSFQVRKRDGVLPLAFERFTEHQFDGAVVRETSGAEREIAVVARDAVVGHALRRQAVEVGREAQSQRRGRRRGDGREVRRGLVEDERRVVIELRARRRGDVLCGHGVQNLRANARAQREIDGSCVHDDGRLNGDRAVAAHFANRVAERVIGDAAFQVHVELNADAVGGESRRTRDGGSGRRNGERRGAREGHVAGRTKIGGEHAIAVASIQVAAERQLNGSVARHRCIGNDDGRSADGRDGVAIFVIGVGRGEVRREVQADFARRDDLSAAQVAARDWSAAIRAVFLIEVRAVEHRHHFGAIHGRRGANHVAALVTLQDAVVGGRLDVPEVPLRAVAVVVEDGRFLRGGECEGADQKCGGFGAVEVTGGTCVARKRAVTVVVAFHPTEAGGGFDVRVVPCRFRHIGEALTCGIRQLLIVHANHEFHHFRARREIVRTEFRLRGVECTDVEERAGGLFIPGACRNVGVVRLFLLGVERSSCEEKARHRRRQERRSCVAEFHHTREWKEVRGE